MRHALGRTAQHLLCKRWLRSRCLRPPVCPLLPFFLALVEPLQRFVDPDCQKLDHRILNPEAPLEFLYHHRFGAELHQHVMPFAVFVHPVSQPALSPLVDFVDGAARIGDILAHQGNEAVDLFFCRIGFNDEQIFVNSHSSSVEPGARRLNFAMDFSTPSAIRDSAASAAWSSNSSSVSDCCRVKRDSR